MSKLIYVAVLTVLFSLGSAEVARAQVGPLIDWIHRMSGPGYARVGVSLPLVRLGSPWTALEVGTPNVLESNLNSARNAPKLRLVPMIGRSTKVRDSTSVPDVDLYLATLQLDVEMPFLRLGKVLNADIVVGAAVNWFFSGDTNDFANVAFPGQLLFRIPVRQSSWWKWVSHLQFGPVANLFLPFPDDAFTPLLTDVSTEKVEWVFGGVFMVELGTWAAAR